MCEVKVKREGGENVQVDASQERHAQCNFRRVERRCVHEGNIATGLSGSAVK
jgi:hypothetical protein